MHGVPAGEHRELVGPAIGLASWDDSASVSSGYWSGAENEQESHTHEMRLLCASLATSVIAHAKLPQEVAHSFRRHLPNVCACSLAMLWEDGKSLRRLGLVEQGSVCRGELAPGEAVAEVSAAWQAFKQRKSLVWPNSGGRLMFPDWRTLIKVHAAEGLVTVPLVYCTDAALGSITFALNSEPSSGEVELLELYAKVLAQHISHQTKTLWEVSLGFVNHVVPQQVVHRMLGAVAASDSGPLPAPGAHALARPPQRADVRLEPATPIGTDAPAGSQEGGKTSTRTGSDEPAGGKEGVESQPLEVKGGGPTARRDTASGVAAGHTPEAGKPSGAAAPHAVEPHAAPAEGGGRRNGAGTVDSAMEESEHYRRMVAAVDHGPSAKPGSWYGTPLASPTPLEGMEAGSLGLARDQVPASPLRFILPDRALEDVPLQKWTLEFVDPRLEELYKAWFNGRQADTDLLVFRSYVVMLLLVVVGLLVCGPLSWGGLLMCCQVLATVAAPAYLMLHRKAWYIKNRSLIVVAARTTSCIAILSHAYHHPELYGDSLLKALCGNCALSIALNTFRSKLRFTNHLTSQLIKLYLCSTFNAFLYSDPAQACQQYLSLGQSTAAQLVAVLLPSIGLYRMEARQRRSFVLRRGDLGM